MTIQEVREECLSLVDPMNIRARCGNYMKVKRERGKSMTLWTLDLTQKGMKGKVTKSLLS